MTVTLGRMLALLPLTLLQAHQIDSDFGKASSPISFFSGLSDFAVLQRAPAAANVYGVLGDGGTAASVTVVSESFAAYTVVATVDTEGKRWKAALKPMPSGGDVTVTATCTGCSNATAAVLRHVTFGDVFYCAGQSNMWLPLGNTLTRNATVDALSRGDFSNIRLMAGDSQIQSTSCGWGGGGNSMGDLAGGATTDHTTKCVWQTASAAATDGICTGVSRFLPNGTQPATCSLERFSAACYYFAEELTKKMVAAGETPPVIGLVSTAVGGSMIEEWLPNSTSAQCTGRSVAAHDETLWTQNVVPFLPMTVKGWLWYQGENNCHGIMGNSAQKTGYGCQMPLLVSHWRQAWAAASGTDPMAPFGVVTLAAGGDEGGNDIGGMRWSQTANYGVLPNPAMPNTFLAQAFDMGDPWDGLDQCVKGPSCCRSNNHLGDNCGAPSGHCYGRNVTTCPDKKWQVCKAYCESKYNPKDTTPYMGGIHPRDKRPVGLRLATAAAVLVYGIGAEAKDPYTGPTIAGCSHDAAAKTITLRFNQTLLGNDAVMLTSYGPPPPGMNGTAATITTGLRVLINGSYWCSNSSISTTVPGDVGPKWCPGICGTAQPPAGSNCSVTQCVTKMVCRDTDAPDNGNCGGRNVCGADAVAPRGGEQPGVVGVGGSPQPQGPEPWIELDIKLGAKPGEVIVDLAKLNGSEPLAIRYAWEDEQKSCCLADSGLHSALYPCLEASCPIKTKRGMLPANPFMAAIVGGRCKCVPPQVCDV